MIEKMRKSWWTSIRTIAGELDMGALEAKREFLMKFLSRKLVELNEILASRRTRNFGRKETTGPAKYVKFKDKTFQMVECPEDVQVTEEIMEENVFLSSVSGNPKSGNVKKNCPLKCGCQHRNGGEKSHSIKTSQHLHSLFGLEDRKA